MGWFFLFGLIAWPILEIYTFVQVGQWIGFINTILLFLGAGVIGLWLLRSEGISLLMRARSEMQQGVAPLDEAFDALCLVLGGLLLMLPGFISDVMALLLFLPPVRSLLKAMIARHVVVRNAGFGAPQPMIIDGEFEEVSPADPDPIEGPSAKIVHKRD